MKSQLLVERATTLLAGLGAMLLMGGGESSGSARGSDDKTKEEL